MLLSSLAIIITEQLMLSVTRPFNLSPVLSLGPSSPCIYLAPLLIYGASKIMRSQPWPFGVTWRHWSRDHSTGGGRLPMSGPWRPCVYLAPLWRYGITQLLDTRTWTWKERKKKGREKRMKRRKRRERKKGRDTRRRRERRRGKE